MILAVLEARAGVIIGANDVYLNVAGGLKVREPAADLAVAAALLSSLTGTVIPHGTAVFGEVALSGAIRPVGKPKPALRKRKSWACGKPLLPQRDRDVNFKGLKVKSIETISDLVAWTAAQDKGLRRIV